MPTASKADRRQIAQEFKDRKVRRGIYAVNCTATGETWIGSTPNLDAAWNSLRFQLNIAHRNHSLLAAWKQHGEPAFTFEVLEQLDDDISPFVVSDTLTKKKSAWIETLSARAL
jgi:hypothetical protein